MIYSIGADLIVENQVLDPRLECVFQDNNKEYISFSVYQNLSDFDVQNYFMVILLFKVNGFSVGISNKKE